MDKLLGLFLNGFHDLRVAVPGGHDGDPSGKVEKAVAIYVPNLNPAPMIHDKGVTARIRRGDNGVIPGNIVTGLRTR